MSNIPNIICVDDDKETIDMMAFTAMSYGDAAMFHLHQSIGGALKRLAHLHYNVAAIILDISLEDGSGRELTEHIRNHEQNYGRSTKIPIFWYTGWKIDLEDVHDPFTQTFYACEVVKLFVKPTTPQEMFDEVLMYINTKKSG